jgi:hypothetical protein
MGEPLGSGGSRERVEGARRKCSDQYRSRFYAQDFRDHGGDHHETSNTDFGPPRWHAVMPAILGDAARAPSALNVTNRAGLREAS